VIHSNKGNRWPENCIKQQICGFAPKSSIKKWKTLQISRDVVFEEQSVDVMKLISDGIMPS
jgi:hypothetical protein